MIKFITGRIKAIFYSIKGAFLLLKTEHSIQAQSFIALLFNPIRSNSNPSPFYKGGNG